MEAEKTDVVSIPTQNKERANECDGEIMDTTVCRIAFFAGRDGNDLMLHNRCAPHAS